MTAVRELRAAVDPARLQAIADALPIDRDGAALHCPSPDHDDDSASAGVFLATQAGAPHGRWKCQGCGAGGDAVELVRLALDVDFAEACRWLDAWLDEQPARPASRPPDRPSLRVELVETAMAQTRNAERLATAFFADKGIDVPAAWAVGEWRLGATGQLLWLPWFAAPVGRGAGRLVGATKRWFDEDGGWRKKSERSSQRADVFYGEWRDQGRRWVVVCEGETDTLAVAWWLRDRVVDVLGVAGASTTLTDGMAARLAGRSAVLVPDADAPGQAWAQRWLTGLAQEPRTRCSVARLPRGTDAVGAGRRRALAAVRSAVRGRTAAKAPRPAMQTGRGATTTATGGEPEPRT